MKQLGINPEMDKLARDNGLGHWSCVSPLNHEFWVRRDGYNCAIDVMMFSDFCITTLKQCDKRHPIGKDWQQPTIQDQVNLDLYKHEKTVEDLIKLASNDPIIANLFNAYKTGCFSSQRAMLIELAFVLSSTLSDAREKLKNEIEHRVPSISIDLSHFTEQQKEKLIDDLKTNSRLNRDFKPTIEPVINHPTLVQKPFKYPCDGALYFTKTHHFQVFITKSTDDVILADGKEMNCAWDAKTGELLVNKNVFHNDDLDLIMFVWE